MLDQFILNGDIEKGLSLIDSKFIPEQILLLPGHQATTEAGPYDMDFVLQFIIEKTEDKSSVAPYIVRMKSKSLSFNLIFNAYVVDKFAAANFILKYMSCWSIETCV
jgi:hypothetical protein